MSGWKKLASAAAASGEALNVEDVFSTYLYEGNSGNQTITNGIDLSTEGGMVWIKDRTGTSYHALFDTERGANVRLIPSGTNAEYDLSDVSVNGLTAFNTDGFDLGSWTITNDAADDHASWTFRKAPKFFDVVTWTGDGTPGRTISHSLGSAPGCIIVKNTSQSGNWPVYHRGMTSAAYGMALNATVSEFYADAYWDSTDPTDTVFTVGNSGDVNTSGQTYVAYLFAHNDGDGGFGPNGDADIIKCGSYTGNGSDSFNGPEIDLGFEPQWLLIKNTSSSGSNWVMVDNMRGIPGSYEFGGLFAPLLFANKTDSEDPEEWIRLLPNGFSPTDGAVDINSSGSNYIYMAIRRGPMAVPESATDVFAIDTKTDDPRPAFISDFPVDMALWRRKHTTSNWANSARLIQGKFLYTNDFTTEGSNTINAFDFQDGWYDDQGADNRILSWMWKRAPNFFDVVCYTGNGTAGRTVSHNLGVAPEMMWVKGRSIGQNWAVYNPNGRLQLLNQSGAEYSAAVTDDYFGNGSVVIAPTETEFTLGTASPVNSSGSTYIAYLFATLDGVSKLGSYTGNGGTSVTGTGQNIDCGFSSGARFVLIKPTNAADHWFVYDSERGIVAGNDATLQLNLTTGESVSSDEIDPYSSGFTILNGNNQLNRTGREYIFYAIA